DREDAILFSKHSDLGIPVSIVVLRTMNQDERNSASAFQISHGISVDFDRLDAIWQRPNALHCCGSRELGPMHTSILEFASRCCWINHSVDRFRSHHFEPFA